jgi:hypothetical protein
MPLVLLLACAPPDECDAMCDAALDRYGACIEENGLEWGESVGYTSPADFTTWCETWTWEARQLDEAGSCVTKLATFEEGTCADYYAAWASR